MSRSEWKMSDYSHYQQIIKLQKEIVNLQKKKLENNQLFIEQIESAFQPANESENSQKNGQQNYIDELEKLVKKQDLMLNKQLENEQLNKMYIDELHKLIDVHEKYIEELKAHIEGLKNNPVKRFDFDSVNFLIIVSIIFTFINLFILWWKK